MALPDERPAPPGQDEGVVVLALPAEVTRAGVPLLCERLRELLDSSGAGWVVCDAGALDAPGLAAVEALARLRLTAARLGRGFRIHRAGAELRQLLALTGLDDALRLQPGGQAEQREEAVGVEEGVEPADPPL